MAGSSSHEVQGTPPDAMFGSGAVSPDPVNGLSPAGQANGVSPGEMTALAKAKNRSHDPRVNRHISNTFPDFPVSVVERNVVSNRNLRTAIAYEIFDPKDGSPKDLSTTKGATLREEFAVGDISEALLKLTPADLKDFTFIIFVLCFVVN